jgi:DNA-binding beta-propeller fold protein YncE
MQRGARYGPSGTKPLREITDGLKTATPESLAFDSAGDLYVGAQADVKGPHYNVVDVYAPGKKTLLRSISQNCYDNIRIALDPHDNLYVSCAMPQGGSVRVYAAGTKKLIRTITSGLGFVQGLAFDRTGNLYVANYSRHSITVYAPDSGSVLRTLTRGVDQPLGVALDSLGNVYVPDSRVGTVTVYASGTTDLLRTIKGFYQYDYLSPQAVALDKDNRLFVAAPAIQQ